MKIEFFVVLFTVLWYPGEYRPLYITYRGQTFAVTFCFSVSNFISFHFIFSPSTSFYFSVLLFTWMSPKDFPVLLSLEPFNAFAYIRLYLSCLVLRLLTVMSFDTNWKQLYVNQFGVYLLWAICCLLERWTLPGACRPSLWSDRATYVECSLYDVVNMKDTLFYWQP